jgi:hypothetical protein
VRAVVEKGLSKTRSTIDEKQPLDAVWTIWNLTCYFRVQPVEGCCNCDSL